MDEVPLLKDEKEEIEFVSPGHQGLLLKGLDLLRVKGLLIDVTLVAAGESFDAHRVVLASCSDYFKAMFTSEVVESRQREIRLEGIPAQGISYLLDYAYTAKLRLGLNNIQDVLSAASHIQVPTVVEACSNYLQAQLDLENCVDILTLAETYSLVTLRKHVCRFISDNLIHFSKTAEFQRLSASELKNLLAAEYPVDCEETDVLQIVLQWISYDLDNRLPSQSELLNLIHFEEIPPSVLRVIWEHSILPHISAFPLLYERVMSQMFGRNRNRRRAIPTLINSRGMELAILKVGGFGITGVTNGITYFLPSTGRWKRLTAIPHVDQSNYGTAVIQNILYVVGGCFNQCLQENIHPFGFSYNPRWNSWSTMAPMLIERCRFSLNVVDSKIYAVGGAHEALDEEFGTCERYDPMTDVWTPLPRLPCPRSQHAGAGWKEYLFISGGLEGDTVSDSLLCLNTKTLRWDKKPSLLKPRADHSMIAYKGKLYVCGGWCEDEAVGNRILLSSIDEFDLHENRWRVVSQIPTPRFHAGVTIVNSKLYVVGGFYSDLTFDRTTGVIECLDLETWDWSTLERYPEDIWEHACVPIYVPKCREDMEVVRDLNLS